MDSVIQVDTLGMTHETSLAHENIGCNRLCGHWVVDNKEIVYEMHRKDAFSSIKWSEEQG